MIFLYHIYILSFYINFVVDFYVCDEFFSHYVGGFIFVRIFTFDGLTRVQRLCMNYHRHINAIICVDVGGAQMLTLMYKITESIPQSTKKCTYGRK